MSAELVIDAPVAREFTELAGVTEHVGFLLAEWDARQRRFSAFEWRPVSEDEYEVLTDFHVALSDEIRASVIKWAWDCGGCLIETHSHGPRGKARFSPSDLRGFTEWVPHVRWRLKQRPYVALVTTGEAIDGWAWISDDGEPEQVERVVVNGQEVQTTGATAAWVKARR
jgi:hypothetical protein